MKSIKKILPVAMMIVVLATNSISAYAACFGGGDHYRPPGVRCYGSCIHPGYEANGVYYLVGHMCKEPSCGQFRPFD
ncbi:MAG: hypothetical protein FWC09_01700 [Lachnospiraceae bacterium]|nr:hypothetical protein [Lachnospiraceae bacterium]